MKNYIEPKELSESVISLMKLKKVDLHIADSFIYNSVFYEFINHPGYYLTNYDVFSGEPLTYKSLWMAYHVGNGKAKSIKFSRQILFNDPNIVIDSLLGGFIYKVNAYLGVFSDDDGNVVENPQI